jgi:hypothetical protein
MKKKKTVRKSAFSLPYRRKSDADRPPARIRDEAVTATFWNTVELAAAYLNFM